MGEVILLVDDDITQLALFKKLLTISGYVCKTALSVDEAEGMLKNELPDLIISDYHMPVKDGFHFRRKLLKDDQLRQIPFLFLTAINDNNFIQQGLDLKANDYISKTTPPKQILSKIENLMQSVRLQNQKSLSEIKRIAEKLNLRNTPVSAPLLKNFEINFYNNNYKNEPGGDFIDFIQISQRYTFVILGDVMGKKWGAWFFSFSFLSYIRSAIRLCVYDGTFSLSEILNKLNIVIHYDELLDDIFSTLGIISIDDELGKITYAGAGDLPVLKYKQGLNEILSYQSEGILLGFSKESSFNEMEIELNPEEELYMISDGMIDFEIEGAKRSNINIFKTKLLKVKQSGKSTDDIKSILFDKHISQVDDCSMITIKRLKHENK